MRRFAFSFRGCGPCGLAGTFGAICALARPFRVELTIVRFVATLAASVAVKGSSTIDTL